MNSGVLQGRLMRGACQCRMRPSRTLVAVHSMNRPYRTGSLHLPKPGTAWRAFMRGPVGTEDPPAIRSCVYRSRPTPPANISRPSRGESLSSSVHDEPLFQLRHSSSKHNENRRGRTQSRHADCHSVHLLPLGTWNLSLGTSIPLELHRQMIVTTSLQSDCPVLPPIARSRKP